MASVLYRPAKGNITNGYRSQPSGGKPSHLALDFGWGNGTAVYAAETGILSYDTSAGYGKRLSIKHSKNISGKVAITRYAHLASVVKTSGNVTRGQLIGYMGNTGSFAEFVHLHFELLLNGKKSNPVSYFTDTAGGGGTPITPEPKKDIDMLEMIYWKPTSTTTSWAVWGIGVWLPINRQETANNAKSSLAPHLPSRLVTTAESERIKAVAQSLTLTAPAIDYEALATSIVAKLPANSPLTEAEVMAIAKAVNDDAAKRLAS